VSTPTYIFETFEFYILESRARDFNNLVPNLSPDEISHYSPDHIAFGDHDCRVSTERWANLQQ